MIEQSQVVYLLPVGILKLLIALALGNPLREWSMNFVHYVIY